MTAINNSSQASTTDSPVAPQRKPRFALFFATAGGLGYIPFAPGTLGSLAGALLSLLPWWSVYFWIAVLSHGDSGFGISAGGVGLDPFLFVQICIAAVVAAMGVWSANRAARFWSQNDPQRVVIDEVSGQHLALLLGCAIPLSLKAELVGWSGFPLGLVTVHSPLNWKYLLVGFILFRVFDVWKPFPARQAESLPGGWGIMADDWVAGICAGIGLWVARLLGL